MSLRLPKAIETYLACENANDAAALDQCFAGSAIVRDEGRTIQGLAAIKAWTIASKEKYKHTVEPLRVREGEGKTTVTSRVSGRFPGSPVELDFTFGLENDRIVSLEIR